METSSPAEHKDTVPTGEAVVVGLCEALDAYIKEFAHQAPEDCYSTGPRTGDFIQDHVVCPGCAALEKARAALKKARGES